MSRPDARSRFPGHRAVVRGLGWLAFSLCLTACPTKPTPLVDEEFEEELDVEEEVTDAAVDGEVKEGSDTKDAADVKPETKDGETKDGDATVTPDVDAADAAADSQNLDGDTGSDVEAQDGDATGEVDVAPDVSPTACVVNADCESEKKDACTAKFICKFSAKAAQNLCLPVLKSTGAACDDGNACTQGDHCDDDGTCKGPPTVCADTDGSVCTIEVCKPVTGCPGKGQAPAAPDDSPCDDGNACTYGDYCSSGVCSPGDKNKCQCQNDADCLKYDDADKCNGKLVCSGDECVPDKASVVVCDAKADTKCVKASCDPKTGTCAPKTAINGTWCPDGNACTAPDQCVEGVCVANSLECNDKNLCTDDACDPKQGCVFANNKVFCNDGNACTDGDACDVGACKPGKATCECQADADCKAKDDGDPCTGVLVCTANKCAIKAGSVVVCAAATPCDSEACAPQTGKCVKQPKAVGGKCDDGNACTQNDVCDGKGTCIGGKALTCNDGNACTDDACLDFAGCQNTFNKSPCEDDDFCTKGDYCSYGTCTAGKAECACKVDADCAKFASADKCLGPITCDFTKICEHDPKKAVTCDTSKDTPCFATQCLPATGACGKVNAVDGGPCNDGKPCTVDDTCTAGACSSKVQKECNDGNPCTLDSCDDANKVQACQAKPFDGKPCDDGNACTGPDKSDLCTEGKCKGAPVLCKEVPLDCVVDSCEPAFGCIKQPESANSPCEDGNGCTGHPGNNGVVQDECDSGGKCQPGGPKKCDDGNACTTDSCDPTSPQPPPDSKEPWGCKFAYNTQPCNDNDPCSEGTSCFNGLCTGALPVVCDDKNPCTDDSCVKDKNGCVFDPNTVTCNDGSECTTTDICGGGNCAGVLKNCDDQNICTTDACDATKGCNHAKDAKANCGAFAKCSDDAVSKCVFGTSGHMVISEIYRGIAGKAADDWVELYNPSTNTVDLAIYAVEARAGDADDNNLDKPKVPWVELWKGGGGQKIGPYGYFLVGMPGLSGFGIVQGGVALDGTMVKGLDDAIGGAKSLQVRLRDVAHQLNHDAIGFGAGATAVVDEGAPLAEAIPDAGSIERKAAKASTAESMSVHKSQWLFGNSYDSGSNAADFVLRLAPEPQNGSSGQYEPACNSTCPVGQVCDFKGPGLDKCVADATCKRFGVDKAACGSGKSCNPGIAGCLPDYGSTVVVSEIYMGSVADLEAQYVELYNSSKNPIDLSAMILQRKPPSFLPSDPWLSATMQFPAGTVLKGNHHLVVATQLFAQMKGGVDVVVAGSFGLEGSGGALRLWDPRVDLTLDFVGWGTAKTYGGAGALNLQPAPAVPKGQSLERKANEAADPLSMDAGGKNSLAGNGHDSDDDGGNWLVQFAPTHQSQASGGYEPACQKTCASGYVCTYTPGSEKCVDPACGGQCTAEGLGCNIKASKCDKFLEIAEFSVFGPSAYVAPDLAKGHPGNPNGAKDQKGAPLDPIKNGYVVLYNPTAAAIKLDGLVLRWKAWNGSSFNQLTATSAGTGKFLLTGYVEPYSWFLVAPALYDATLPKPDYIAGAATPWDLSEGGLPIYKRGFIQLVRLNGTYEGGTNEADKVAWGADMASMGEGKTAAPPQPIVTELKQVTKGGEPVPIVTQVGAVRRIPAAGVTGAMLDNPLSSWRYAGAGHDTANSAADWVALPSRQPKNSKSPAHKP